MALTNCPYCRETISNASSRCPKCGSNLKDYRICKECNSFVHKQENECPNCGCKMKKGGTLKIVLALLAIILAIGGFFFYKIEKERDYQLTYTETVYMMLDSCAEAETTLNETLNVWHHSIFQVKDTETNKYTMKNGVFYDDFNDALAKYYEGYTFKNHYSKIQNSYDTINENILKLQNPPSKFSAAFTALMNYYQTYTEFINLAISPNGSYNSVSDDFNEIDTRTINLFRGLQVYLIY